MANAWWGTAIQWLIWFVLMALAMRWLAKSRHRVRPESQRRELAHPASTLVIGLVCFGLFAGLAIVSNVVSNKTVTWRTTALFVGFALLGVPIIADYFSARHKVSEQGMTYRTLTGVSKDLHWSELRSVQYAPGMKWFRLETQSGDVARISAMLMGLPEFARLLLEHTPKHVIENKTRPVLEATANGRPPSIWA